MAKRNRSSVEKYHDRVAGLYDTIYDGNPYWEIVFEITWRHILKHIPKDQSIRCLDIGCGTGRWGMRLTKSGYKTDFLDISHKMLDQVRTKLVRSDINYVEAYCMEKSFVEIPDPNKTDEVIVYHASVDDMSMIKKESYDFIVGQGDPLNCSARPERTVKQLANMLKPGGVMLMSVDNRWAGIYHYFKEDNIAGLEDFIKTGKTKWVTDNEDERYDITMFTPDQIRKMCADRNLELLSLIGKTILPLRRFREMIADREKREQLMRLEEKLNSTEALLGTAAHLEFVAKKPEKG